MHTARTAQLTEGLVRRLVEGWCAALDRHAPAEEVQAFLVPDGLVMFLHEGTYKELEGFRSWYEGARRRYADESRTASSVRVRLDAPLSGVVELVLSWRGRAAGPSQDGGRWLGFDEYQTWTVVLDGGAARIRTCAVRGRVPRPDGGGAAEPAAPGRSAAARAGGRAVTADSPAYGRS
ncbi:nuclear transport factor 2 family protein [Streptomyces sp. NPDC006326]|uniref:nuclear transport factor 2 family protein n=1 Tax=Streptomyces sp. NPDC006326 TaxID=3156752 RepID=UPI0033AE36EC